MTNSDETGDIAAKSDGSEAVPEELTEIIVGTESLPRESRELVRDAGFRLAMRASYSESFSSPLPPAWVLREYEVLLPGSTDRILKLTERQQSHRISMESKNLSSDIWLARAGLVFGLIIVLTAMAFGRDIILSGRDIAGFVLAISTVVTLAGVFVYAQTRREAERRQRMKELMQGPPKEALPAPTPSKTGKPSTSQPKKRRRR